MPKKVGGPSLRDLDLLDKVMGAKTWWHSITIPTTPWAKLWKVKYAPMQPLESLIRLSGILKGSPICNQAWDNRSLIQDHCFWEICNGEKSLFWEDAWEQRPKLNSNTFLPIRMQSDRLNKNVVKDFWKTTNNLNWREWMDIREMAQLKCHQSAAILAEELKKRQIQRDAEPAKLWWGSNVVGSFNIKDVYSLLLALDAIQLDAKWKRLWNINHWSKISLFI